MSGSVRVCKCGCGEVVKKGNKFVRGHNSRTDHPMLGKKHSAETLKKLSDSHQGPRPWRIGFTHTPETCAQLSRSHAGVPLSEKHRTSIGIASKKVWAEIDGEKRKKWVKKIGDGNKGKVVSESTRIKLSIANKKVWENPEHAKKCLVINSPNKEELKLMGILEKMYPGEWKFVGDGQVVIAGKCPDFININGQKKIIEYYGYRWHKNDNPQDRIDVFAPFGYETLIVWDKDLRNSKKVKSMLNDFCGVK